MADTEVRREPVVTKNFFDAVDGMAVGGAHGQRKTVTAEVAASVVADNSIKMPGHVDTLLGKFKPEFHGAILDAVLNGAAHYEREHGFRPDPSFLEHALFNAVQTTRPLGELMGGTVRLDNATSAHHDQLSLVPATPVLAIMSQFDEPCPFAAYLPADLKSNEARLAILTHLAQSDHGSYASGDSLDGINAGGDYLNCERNCVLSINGGGAVGTPLVFVVTQKSSPAVGGVPVGPSNVAVPLLRSRTEIIVNGLPAAREIRETGNYGSGNNAVAGQVTIGATSYSIGGTVNSDTGAMSITSTPALPAGVVVEALAYIDYEKAPQLAPIVGVDVAIFPLFARASRGLVKTSMDAMTQMQAEMNIDPRGQALLALRKQAAIETHKRAFKKMLRIGANQSAIWNFNFAVQTVQKDISQMWLNFQPILVGLSQVMANSTVDHGIDTLYVTGELSARIQGLPSTMWQASGVTARPGCYRLGTLFGMYSVYYAPPNWGLVDTGITSQVMCIGKGSQVGRNPYIIGDAVPAIFLPLAMNSDLVQADGYYTRGFGAVNPHLPSAQAAALVNVIGMA